MEVKKINEKMNLVIPVFDQDEVTITAYVHSKPISAEVFEAHFLLISRTFTAIHGEGLGAITGPRVAGLMMKRIAKNAGLEDEYIAFTAEIRRLTNVLMRNGQNGWTTIPYEEVVNNRLLPVEDIAEVDNGVVFFTVYSATHRKMAMEVLPGAARMWGAQISSLSLSEFIASLPTSTATDNTGGKTEPVSSVPF